MKEPIDEATVKLFIPGTPIPMPRAKASRRGNHIHMRTPTKTPSVNDNGVKGFRAAIAIVCAVNHPAKIISGAVRVDCLYLFPRQARKVWKTKPMPRYRHVSRPDIDNLDKMVFDSITQAMDSHGVPYIWHDDTQVQCGSHEKWYCSGDEQPGTFVKIWALDE